VKLTAVEMYNGTQFGGQDKNDRGRKQVVAKSVGVNVC